MICTSVCIIQYITWTINNKFSVFQQINDFFSLWSCCTYIVFSVIRHKEVKRIITCTNMQGWLWCSLASFTEVFQCNSFNINCQMIPIVFRLNVLLQNWLLRVLHNLDVTRYIGVLNDAWITINVCFHCDGLHLFVHLVSVMQVSVLKSYRIFYVSQQLMPPSWQAFFLHKF